MARINEISIDIGTSNILVYGNGYGMMAKIPAVVAVNRDTGAILKYGSDAYNIIGRTPQHILTIYPLRNGEIRDPGLVNSMLQYCVSTAIGGKKRFFSKPRAMVAFPSKVNSQERRLLHSSLYDAGLGNIYAVNRCLAAVIGMHIAMDDPTGTMIIDMGGSVTDISVISSGRIIEHSCIPIGGDSFSEAIMRYLYHAFSLQIGVSSAENLKTQHTTALAAAHNQELLVPGRSTVTNLPHTVKINTSDLTEAINEPLQKLIYEIKDVLQHTDPALVSDIFMYGAVLSGGPARMPGLSEAIGLSLNLPVVIADSVDENIVTGCSMALHNIRHYSRYLEGNR